MSQECNKEMHQNKRVESSRCAQIKGHRFHSKQSRLRTPLDDLSLGEITHARRRICHVAIARSTARAAAFPGHRPLAVRTRVRHFAWKTRPRNEDAPAATCLNFYASRSFCFKFYTRQMHKATEMISELQQRACPRALKHLP